MSAAAASSLCTVSQPPVNMTAVNRTGDSRSSSASLLPLSLSSACSLIGALPTLDSILSLKTPTLHHVPKGVRDTWAQIVGDALSAVVSSPSDVSVWCTLFMLARCILVSPPRRGPLTSACYPEAADRNFIQHQSHSRTKGTSPESLRRANASRARLALEDGQYRKQCSISSRRADVRIRRFIENRKSFHLVIKDFLSSGKIEGARSTQGATLCLRYTSDILVLCSYFAQVKF